MLNDVVHKNPSLNLLHISDLSFRQYGKIINDFDVTPLIAYAEENIPIPSTGVKYEPSIESIEKMPIAKQIGRQFFGELPAQFGYTNGMATTMDALEWHRSSELVIAVTDLIVLLGKVWDIGAVYDSKNVVAFYVPKGVAFEIYATTLHYAPCRVSEKGYKSIVVLPKGTNSALDFKKSDQYLWAKNKWLISHPSVSELADEGALCIITGENIKINL